MCAVHYKAFCSSGSHLSISGKSANSTKILPKESMATSSSFNERLHHKLV